MKYKGWAVVGKGNEIISVVFDEPKEHRPLVLLGFTTEEAKALRREQLLRIEFTLNRRLPNKN